MEPIPTPDFEAKKFTPGDVLDSLDVIVVELRRYKDEIGAEDEITPTPLVANKTPSDVYENIWRASYLLDGVAGHLDPNTVFRNVVAVQAEVGLIAAKLGVRIRSTALKPKPGKTPTDVNIEGFKNFHRVGRLQRLMGMDPLRPPSFPAGKVSPSDCYDTKNILIAELIRIKVELGITEKRAPISVPLDKRPPDVLAEFELVGTNLETIIGSL
jgi:hypothetical protein